MPPISGEWAEALAPEFKKPYYKKLFQTVSEEYRTHRIFPPGDDIFNAFHLTPLPQVKVVILGQDPYHGEGQAHGLCFSVRPDVEIPPSLVNIYKELEEDVGCYIPNNGYLEKWARQGVLLLNTVLTVRAHQANSHRGIGWEEFHRRGHTSAGCPGSANGFYFMGKACPGEKAHDYQSKASGAFFRPSQPAVRLPRLFRQPGFQQDKSISGESRAYAHRLAD